MTDLALHWDAEAMTGDLALAGRSLAVDDGLRTAILLSLFTDARARADDPLPTPDADRRGWWGNAHDRDGTAAPELGSRLWLLERSKTTAATLIRAREYATEALSWLVDDGIAERVDVTVERQTRDATDCIAIGVVVERTRGAGSERFDLVWEASQ